LIVAKKSVGLNSELQDRHQRQESWQEPYHFAQQMKRLQADEKLAVGLGTKSIYKQSNSFPDYPDVIIYSAS